VGARQGEGAKVRRAKTSSLFPVLREENVKTINHIVRGGKKFGRKWQVSEKGGWRHSSTTVGKKDAEKGDRMGTEGGWNYHSNVSGTSERNHDVAA